MIARLAAFLRRSRAGLARMGGYWGGVIMHGLRRAADFLRL